jgi:hypothetical protein
MLTDNKTKQTYYVHKDQLKDKNIHLQCTTEYHKGEGSYVVRYNSRASNMPKDAAGLLMEQEAWFDAMQDKMTKWFNKTMVD